MTPVVGLEYYITSSIHVLSLMSYVPLFLGCIERMRCSLLLPMIAASVRQSVCQAAHLGFTVQKWLNNHDFVWGKHS